AATPLSKHREVVSRPGPDLAPIVQHERIQLLWSAVKAEAIVLSSVDTVSTCYCPTPDSTNAAHWLVVAADPAAGGVAVTAGRSDSVKSAPRFFASVLISAGLRYSVSCARRRASRGGSLSTHRPR